MLTREAIERWKTRMLNNTSNRTLRDVKDMLRISINLAKALQDIRTKT